PCEQGDLESLAPVGAAATPGPTGGAAGRGWRGATLGPGRGGRRRDGPAAGHGVTRRHGHSLAAASTTALTTPAASPLPASMLTTAVLRALPTFWPRSVSSQTVTY